MFKDVDIKLQFGPRVRTVFNLLGDYFQILQIEVDKGSISIDLYMTDIILITWNFSSLFLV